MRKRSCTYSFAYHVTPRFPSRRHIWQCGYAPFVGTDAYEFPLRVAACHSTVDEVEAALVHTAIIDEPINEKYPSSLLHWIIGDATRSIMVEQTAAGLHARCLRISATPPTMVLFKTWLM